MRISKTWLRPILTAVLFPVVLIGIMWALDEYGQWRAERLVNVTRQQAVALAWSECFSKAPPGTPAAKWTYVRIGPAGWEVETNQTYVGSLLQAQTNAVAVIASEKPFLVYCRVTGLN